MSLCSVQMFLSITSDGDRQNRTPSPDDVSRSSSSTCCCHGNRFLSSAADGHGDSGLSLALSDAAAATRIAEMEAELAQLRQQLALIVMAQERASHAGRPLLTFIVQERASHAGRPLLTFLAQERASHADRPSLTFILQERASHAGRPLFTRR